MKFAQMLGGFAFASAVIFSSSANATNVTTLGNLNNGPVVGSSLFSASGFFLPDYFTFSLSTKSNILVDIDQFLGVSIGGTFSLQNTTGGNLQTYNLPNISFVSGPDFSFNGIDAGSYRFAYNPGLVTAAVGAKVSFTATPVPEPETNALMMVGLGLMGFIARRKFVK